MSTHLINRVAGNFKASVTRNKTIEVKGHAAEVFEAVKALK